MKIAVTSQDQISITQHAGRCTCFWVYEIEHADIVAKQLVELPENSRFLNLSSSPLLNDINVLITGGMASELRYFLKQQAIQSVITRESNPERAVKAWLNGTLEELPPVARLGACQEHAEKSTVVHASR